MKLIVVSNICYGNVVLEVFECLGLDGDCSIIEKHMTVGANAKQIITSVAAVMRSPKRSDVVRLAVVTATNHKLCAAELAGVAIEKLELAADGRVSNDARDTLKNPVGLGRWIDIVGSLGIAPDVTGDLADAISAANILLDSEEWAVSEFPFARE